MEDNDLGIISAIILSGLVGGERMSADEKTIKRAIELAYRLKFQLKERVAGAVLDPASLPAGPE